MSKIMDMMGESYDIIAGFFKKPTKNTITKNKPYRDKPTGDSNWAKRRKKTKEQLDEIDEPVKPKKRDN